MTERWIVIPNWDGQTGFQHYKDRTPTWIKNYTELMANDAYLSLTLHQRGVLHGLWLEYATARRQIPDSTLTVTRRLGQRVTRATLDALNYAGFIQYSLAKPVQPAIPDKRREDKTPLTPQPTTSKTPTPQAPTLSVKAAALYEKTGDLETVADWLAGVRTLSVGEREQILAEVAA